VANKYRRELNFARPVVISYDKGEQMTRKQSLLFRVILFLFGAGIIALAFFLSNEGKELSRIDIFVWASIAVMYLVFFTPFFFSAIRIGNFSVKIPPLALVWIGISGYIILSIWNIILLVTSMSFTRAIIAQAILLFAFLIDVYFAYFASDHVGRVAVQEKIKQQYVNELKSKSQILLLSVNELPAEYETSQQLLKQSIEDIKYIYPVDNAAGDELELKIIIALKSIAEMCDAVTTGGHPSSMESMARNLQAIVKERKLLRN
jgi:hypothetical protein